MTESPTTPDRVVIDRTFDAPATLVWAMWTEPGLFATQPNVRAGLFARADVRQPGQLQELESYLGRGDLTVEERQSFAALFPLYDLAVSQNLLTPAASRSMGDMIAHDRATIVLPDTRDTLFATIPYTCSGPITDGRTLSSTKRPTCRRRQSTRRWRTAATMPRKRSPGRCI